MTTNAQAALQAAATIYAAGHGHTHQGNVLQAAANFKEWLDNTDRQPPPAGSCPMENPYGERCTYDAGHEGAHSFQLSNTDYRAQGSADRRGTGKRATQCQAIGGTYGSVCYYPAGHDGAHSWQLHQ